MCARKNDIINIKAIKHYENLWHVLGFGLVKIGIWSSILRIWEVISSAAKILTGSAVVIYRARETIFHVKIHVCARAYNVHGDRVFWCAVFLSIWIPKFSGQLMYLMRAHTQIWRYCHCISSFMVFVNQLAFSEPLVMARNMPCSLVCYMIRT